MTIIIGSGHTIRITADGKFAVVNDQHYYLNAALARKFKAHKGQQVTADRDYMALGLTPGTVSAALAEIVLPPKATAKRSLTMKAQDLFAPDRINHYSLITGDYVGYNRQMQEQTDAPVALLTIEQPDDPNQMSLF